MNAHTVWEKLAAAGRVKDIYGRLLEIELLLDRPLDLISIEEDAELTQEMDVLEWELYWLADILGVNPAVAKQRAMARMILTKAGGRSWIP